MPGDSNLDEKKAVTPQIVITSMGASYNSTDSPVLDMDPSTGAGTGTDMDTSTQYGDYKHPFEGINNFRDVGATINEFLGKRVMREGCLFRSGRLDEATPEDKQIFREEYGIKVILDLRTNTERAVRFKRHPNTYTNVSNPKLAEPIVGVEIHNVYIIGRGLEKALLGMLGWWSLIKTIVFMILGFRIPAVKILSKEVFQKVGLVGMGTMSLEYSGEEIKKMFAILTSTTQPPFPVLAHCTQGKDRTGLVILLILLCVSSSSSEIPLEAISHDYNLTQAGLWRIREKMIEEIVNDAGLPPSYVNVESGFVEKVVAFLQERYGGVDGYLGSIGVDVDSARSRLREVLLVEK